MLMQRKQRVPQLGNVEPKTDADRALHAAFRAKFEEVLSRENHLSPRALIEIEQLARLARETISAGAPVLAGAGYTQMGNSFGYDYDTMAPGIVGGVMAPAPGAETFGVGAIRELIEAARKAVEKKSEPTAAELVQAIAAARREGEPEIEKMLREKLKGTLEVAPAELSTQEIVPAFQPSNGVGLLVLE